MKFSKKQKLILEGWSRDKKSILNDFRFLPKDFARHVLDFVDREIKYFKKNYYLVYFDSDYQKNVNFWDSIPTSHRMKELAGLSKKD